MGHVRWCRTLPGHALKQVGPPCHRDIAKRRHRAEGRSARIMASMRQSDGTAVCLSHASTFTPAPAQRQTFPASQAALAWQRRVAAIKSDVTRAHPPDASRPAPLFPASMVRAIKAPRCAAISSQIMLAVAHSTTHAGAMPRCLATTGTTITQGAHRAHPPAQDPTPPSSGDEGGGDDTFDYEIGAEVVLSSR